VGVVRREVAERRGGVRILGSASIGYMYVVLVIQSL